MLFLTLFKIFVLYYPFCITFSFRDAFMLSYKKFLKTIIPIKPLVIIGLKLLSLLYRHLNTLPPPFHLDWNMLKWI